MTDPLEAALQRIGSIEVETAPAGAVSFGLMEDVLDDPRARLAELFDRLWRSIASYADVETQAARTKVGWTGDVLTVVRMGSGPGELQDHAQAVGRTVAVRTARLRILIAATAVATSVLAATATPTAIPSAFRAGWKLAAELESVLDLGTPA